MPGKNKTPLLGWHPPAGLSAWVRAEAERRGVPISTVLNEAAGRLRSELNGERGPARDGVALIAAERRRQAEAEGWTPRHDDGHTKGELARAAACYALPLDYRPVSTRLVDGHGDRGDRYGHYPLGWPWHPDWWKPSADRVRELAKAGALIAAEIDRLLREASPPAPAQEKP